MKQRLGRVPATTAGRHDVNFILTNKDDKVVGSISHVDNGLRKVWSFTLPLWNHEITGTGDTLASAHEKAEAAYTKAQALN